jgi:hypothetical protein
MRISIDFVLDVDPAKWGENITAEVRDEEIATEVRNHAESVVRDLFYDQGWIHEHHPAGHPSRPFCSWCEPEAPDVGQLR